MADTGKQSPLGVNVLGSLLQNIGFYINPTAQSYMGVSKSTQGEYTPGKIVNDTCLKWLTYAINDAYKRGEASGATGPGSTVDKDTYNNLLTIGQSRIAALGNSPPPTWETNDPGNVWVNQYADIPLSIDPLVPGYSKNQAGSPANSGYGFYNWTASYDSYQEDQTVVREQAFLDEGQLASWYPFLATVAEGDVPNVGITQWGWVRCMALQAWNEFNWNGEYVEQIDNTPSGSPAYQFFVDTFSTCDSFKNYSNEAIYAIEDSQTFLKGTFSNQNDLISADIAGVSLSSRSFGQDLINLGKALDLSTINKFGLPSTLLQNLQNTKALTQPLILALLTAGLNQAEINQITSGNITPSKDQEQKIYGAFLVVVGSDLKNILITLNCKTKGLTALSDLLNVKKIFPLSYTTLTVPVYNTNPGPTNSKTYYLLFIKQELNPQLVVPKIKEIIGTIIPPDPPPLPEPLPPPTLVAVEEELPPIILPPPPTPDIPLPFVTGRDPAPGRGGGGGCVALESFIPLIETDKRHNGREITRAWMLENNMKISLGTDNLEVTNGLIVSTLNDYQPCVRIITSDGISLVCSTTAKIKTKEGFVPATELYGKRVAVLRNNHTWYDEVVQLEDVGMKFVRVIDAGNNSFWAGERPGSFILHHNVDIDRQTYNYQKN